MGACEKHDFPSLVDGIVASYNASPHAKHLESSRLPNHDAIVQTIRLLRELLFPGYFGKQNLSTRTLSYYVGDLLILIHDHLFKQIRGARRLHAAQTRADLLDLPNGQTPSAQELNILDPSAQAQAAEDAGVEAIVFDFLAQIPRLRAILETDVQAAFDGDPAATSRDEIIFCYPGFFAAAVYRIAHELHIKHVPIIPRIMTEYAHSVTGADIHPGAEIDEYFFIDHGTGVVIGETCKIGKRAKIYQGVTLGALSTRGGQRLRGVKRHPTLEDDVTVYAGASILGGETIVGRGAIISGNVFITQSVPPNTRVTMKNPELQFRDKKPPLEFKQDSSPLDWEI